jgi:hypothetical protein
MTWERARDMTPEAVTDWVISVFKSAEHLELFSTDFTFQWSRQRRGGFGWTSIPEMVKRRRCIVEIVAPRHDCFFQCIAVYWEKLYTQQTQRQREEQAMQYREAVGHDEGTSVTVDQAVQYGEFFALNVHVILVETLTFITKTERTFEEDVFLLLHDEHYHYVKHDQVGRLWDQARFCFKCFKGFRDIGHPCIEKCAQCRSPDCEGRDKDRSEATITCETCNFSFFNQACFTRHAETLCGTRTFCTTCLIVYKDEEHVCGMYTCTNCNETQHVDGKHECFMLKEEEEKELTENYLFYDYECTLDNVAHNAAGIVAMYYNDATPIRFTTHDDFITWLFSKKHRNYTVIAHNGGRYDMHFIKREMLKRCIKSYDVVNGHKIVYSYVRKFKLRFLDSYSFIHLPLREFPKTFHIEEITKGYFPYRFFTRERLTYKGRMPDLEWFDFDGMHPKERTIALQWYEEHKEDDVDLYEMCMKYCESDVALLREGCIRFRDLFLDLTENTVDPFQYITIASVCMDIYKRIHLPDDAIGLLYEHAGCEREERYWVSVLEQQGEHLERNVDVEGIRVTAVDRVRKRAFFFRDCYDHGCNKCYNRYSVHRVHFQTMDQCRKKHVRDARALRDKGYFVKTMWLCMWPGLKAFDAEAQHAMRNACPEETLPLVMRDAFFGGHTEPTKLYYACQPGEKIRYYDYTSLYPSINHGKLRGLTRDTYDTVTTCTYPIGHPVRITSDFQALDTYYGFVKCRVTPPQDLYLPVLPRRVNGKLVFDLTPCTGTWTTIEVLKAVEKGYVVDEIFEIVHFPNQTDTLFRSYVNTFLKIKQQAAGWEKMNCTTDVEKDAFIEGYAEHMDIVLDKDAIGEYNPGLYFTAKLCLNSLWGKFGQRLSFTNTVDVFTQDDFEKYIYDDDIIIHNVFFHTTLARTIKYERKNAKRKLSSNVNIAIAAFTTAHARLRLYDALDILGTDVLYMDTDSVLFVERDNHAPVVLGPYLGDLTDELKRNEHIEEYVSTGPKSYAYRTNTGKRVCKIKGFTLNFSAQQVLHMDALSELVLDNPEQVLTTYPLQFTIGKDHSITTNPKPEKNFRLTFDKRRILPFTHHAVDTVPYGYFSHQHSQ